ncbi:MULTISPECIES: winged helix DNA-binding domain-containing protein [unclassified Streptomyces]|uniref:winged helix DNA-binding domain-containing protein n=1 Tax=unclassified Streptomyces TaxID=2593676 RepID=UPI002259E020|nr:MULTISPECIES: winged helix DNA-binding domain-containing protein [unclassified Streptomyces]MCX4528807.1 winged helix DNA-binding domain-containing protein [Streptomyces sp. NBC_01551]MCX4540585.1 winged helix DNA-binding domain-containing protein [Streptomyces sp. NBC_01565]
MASRTTHPVIDNRSLNRATLARQLLLGRAGMSARDAVAHLVGLQAQNVKPPYYQLHARLAGFRPAELAGLMESREVVRMVTMRSTIHTHTAHDALTLRPLVQGARDREVNYFRKGLVGVDLERLAADARAFVEAEPRTMGEIREELLKRWPDADPQSLAVAARCRLPLVQVTPRGVWGRSGQVRLTTVESWLGTGGEGTAAAQGVDEVVLRYLGAFGPASVKDMQTWAGLTRLGEAFERLRPRLSVFLDENGAELFDLPDAPRPDADTPAPPRFLPEYDNLLLSHADRSRVMTPEARGRSWVGNQSYRTLLLDGFLAGLWKADAGVLTVELFGKASKAAKEEIVAEGELLLAGMEGEKEEASDGDGSDGSARSDGSVRSVRFGSIHG